MIWDSTKYIYKLWQARYPMDWKIITIVYTAFQMYVKCYIQTVISCSIIPAGSVQLCTKYMSHVKYIGKKIIQHNNITWITHRSFFTAGQT